jgi:hypothetical protein
MPISYDRSPAHRQTCGAGGWYMVLNCTAAGRGRTGQDEPKSPNDSETGRQGGEGTIFWPSFSQAVSGIVRFMFLRMPNDETLPRR